MSARKNNSSPLEPFSDAGRLWERFNYLQLTAPLRPAGEHYKPLEFDPNVRIERKLDPNYRLNLIAEYRRRQQAALRTRKSPRGVESGQGLPGEGPSAPPAVNWLPTGPTTLRRGQAAGQPAVSGRAMGVALDATGTRVYVGSANGGIWRSDDGGNTWTSTMDSFDLNPTSGYSDTLACGAVAIDPTNSNRVFVASGGSGFDGVGVIRTDNGGVASPTWVTEPTVASSIPMSGTSCTAIVVDPNNVNRVVATTWHNIYRREPDGMGGYQWVAHFPKNVLFRDVVAASSAGTTTFYASYIDYSSPTPSGAVVQSTDGATWTAFGTGFPTQGMSNIGLGVQPGNPNTVYAMVADVNAQLLGVYRCNTSDGVWRQINGSPPSPQLFGANGQGDFDLVIAVDPNNVDRVYLAGVSFFRCSITSMGSGAGLTYSMTPTAIGTDVHSDIHGLSFVNNNSDQLWVSCDGGVYYTSNLTGAATFSSRNVGLATLTVNAGMGLHPTQDAVIFAGTQDNGTIRYTGEEAWLHDGDGDSGYCVVNWNDPFQILRTYLNGYIYAATDGGQAPTSWTPAFIPLPRQSLPFPSLVTTPYNPGNPAQAGIVAFAGTRLWYSENFAGTWQSLPNNSSTDDLPGNDLFATVKFVSATKLFAAALSGTVYRFDQSGATWTRTALPANSALSGWISGIAPDPADPTGNSFYASYYGMGDYRHVWHYDAASSTWSSRSGPSPGAATSLLDCAHMAIVVDPANPTQVYVAAYLGVWKSTDGGMNWNPFSDNLPDSAVNDIQLHPQHRLLFAATYGRGVFERPIDATTMPGVQLFIRDTQLERGFRTTAKPSVDWLPDPTQPPTQPTVHYEGPDIKVDAPTAHGTYQTATAQLNYYQFVDQIVDNSGATETVDSLSAPAVNRVYVQVHNRGVQAASGHVTLVIANASTGLPDLPTGYTTAIQNGTAITGNGWQTVGIQPFSGIVAGYPQVVEFDLPSTLLPPPAMLPGNSHYCLVAIIHSIDDAFTSTEVHVDTLAQTERKATNKNLNIVPLPAGGRQAGQSHWIPIRVNGSGRDDVSDLVLDLREFSGAIHVVVPKALKAQLPDEPLKHSPLRLTRLIENIENIRYFEKHGTFNPIWCKEMVHAIEGVKGQPVYVVPGRRRVTLLRNIALEEGTHASAFIAVEPPAGAKAGDLHRIRLYQRSGDKGATGGMTLEIRIVPPLSPGTKAGAVFGDGDRERRPLVTR
jgi:hypothetical protein